MLIEDTKNFKYIIFCKDNILRLKIKVNYDYKEVATITKDAKYTLNKMKPLKEENITCKSLDECISVILKEFSEIGMEDRKKVEKFFEEKIS